MKTNNKIVTFIKAIDKQYYDAFINEGQLCMNTVQWFRDYEKEDSNIGDEFEGSRIACGKNFTVSIADPIDSCKTRKELDQKLNSANWKTLGKGINLKQFNSNENGNIFSMYTVSVDNNESLNEYLVSRRFAKEFDNHRFVIFLEPIKFVSKIESAFSAQGKKLTYGIVKYYPLNEEIIFNLTNFHKPDKYEYQNEFRLMVDDGDATQQILRIGNIEDLCMEIDVNKRYSIKVIDADYFSVDQI